MPLTRDQILEVQDIETREVHVPEWAAAGGDDVVLVREMSGTERDDYIASQRVTREDGRGNVQVGTDSSNLTAKLVARCIVDADGTPLFTVRDAAALGKKSAKALQRVADVVLEMSGMTEDSQDDIEGNSDAAQTGGSTSASPATSEA